jgi:hypothetical protein
MNNLIVETKEHNWQRFLGHIWSRAFLTFVRT